LGLRIGSGRLCMKVCVLFGRGETFVAHLGGVSYGLGGGLGGEELSDG
jgi:hypothetical protein